MAVRTVRWLARPVVAGAVAAAGLVPLTGAGADPGERTRSAVVVRNVIFINGDGMSSAHRKAAQLYPAGRDSRLAMDELPFSGKLTTSPNDPDQAITDSAAGA